MSINSRATLSYNALLVIVGVAGAVVPATLHLAWQLPLFLLFLPGLSAMTAALYVGGWIGLASLWVLLGYLRGKRKTVGIFTWAGIGIGLIAATTGAIFRLSAVAKSCTGCILVLELFQYDPFTLCVPVACHWSVLYIRKFTFDAGRLPSKQATEHSEA